LFHYVTITSLRYFGISMSFPRLKNLYTAALEGIGLLKRDKELGEDRVVHERYFTSNNKMYLLNRYVNNGLRQNVTNYL
jgi:hypothetical protein